MPVVVALLLVVAVHLGTNLAAWGQVGLLADDRFAVGLPILLEWNHASLGERAHAIFLPVVDEGASTALYRPVVSLLFCLEQPWFGVDARWYHAVNSLFHCATAMAWFALVRRWSGLWVAGLAVALAFVGWPGHSEVTHWVSARVNLCAVCFMSLSLFAWDTAERRGANGFRWPMTGVALFLGLLALGSKESAILLLPAAFLVSWLRMGDAGGMVARGWHSALRVLPLFLLFLAFAALRRFVLHTWGAGTSSAWQLDVTSPAAWGA